MKQGRGHTHWIAWQQVLLVVAVLAVVLGACRLTDHSEREVTATALDPPVSGFGEVDPAKLPAIRFDSSLFDMGAMPQGAVVEHAFHFTNTGGSDLIIIDVRGSCGCTVGRDWPRQPVRPGERGTIQVSFDSEGREGHQHKTVSVTANTTPPTTVLTLQGEVLPPGHRP